MAIYETVCEPRTATVNDFGDLVCPACRLNVMTPAGAIVQAGLGRCPRCAEPFVVTRAIAQLANDRAGSFSTAGATDVLRIVRQAVASGGLAMTPRAAEPVRATHASPLPGL